MKISRVSLVPVISFLGLTLALGGTASAGRGGSRSQIQRAIASGSVDAIQAELEQAELLVCPSCTDMVMPLVDHDDYRVRKVAAWWLARRGVSRQLRVAMLTRLSQPDSLAARNAADVLGELHYVSSIPALGAALSNPVFTSEARAAMAQALGQIRRPAVVAPLQTALVGTDATVKAAALRALQQIRGLRDGAAVAPLLADADAGVRSEAAITLGMLRSTTGAEGLVSLLRDDPSATVRKNAAWALGQMNAPSSVASSALQTASVSDPSPLVRSLAASAVTRLSR